MENSQATPSTPPRLLDQVRAQIRVMRYSIRTEEAYTDWVRRFTFSFTTSRTQRDGRGRRRKYHHDLYPRPEQRRSWYYQPVGYVNHP
ncbi:phage integrase N-terminal SAM-like domain-containing protein [Acidithiobacillus ferrooxidans]|uniref:phage integrase N-terminal SAM-like domain-containing protein n=2 Tax=Acidithiobacillus ferrooxidans TaxID=920 RepID=UPI0035ABB55D